MVPSLVLWFILIVSLVPAPGQAAKPFLQRLIEAGFAKSAIDTVYFTASGPIDGSILTGDFPRILMPTQLGIGWQKRTGTKIRIAAQSMVVIDGRDVPENECLTYLLGELEKIVNPGSSKFVLLVNRAFTNPHTSTSGLKALHDVLRSPIVGYTAVLSFSRQLVHSVTRISFGDMVTSTPAELADLWSIFRLDKRSLDGLRVVGLLHQFQPFSYIAYNGRWTGTDFYIWNVVAAQLRLRLQLVYAKPGDKRFIGGMYSPALRDGSIHFVATRDLLLSNRQPKILLFARDHLSLIVPRPSTRSLVDALLQPFTVDLWIFIAVSAGVRVVAAHLTSSEKLQPQLWSEWVRLAADVLTFVLIEAYLAKVTSLLLTLRYTEGPQTLDEFLSARIPILQPLDSTYIMMHAGPEMAARIKERFVVRNISEVRRSTDECYIELRSRVLQLAHGTEPFDEVTGQRNFYILQEPLALVFFQYTFTKESAIKDVFERCLGQYEENGLRVRMEQYFERWAQTRQLRKLHRINSTVLSFQDLHSLWFCLALGWCISATAFLAEYAMHCVGKGSACRIWRK